MRSVGAINSIRSGLVRWLEANGRFPFETRLRAAPQGIRPLPAPSGSKLTYQCTLDSHEPAYHFRAAFQLLQPLVGGGSRHNGRPHHHFCYYFICGGYIPLIHFLSCEGGRVCALPLSPHHLLHSLTSQFLFNFLVFGHQQAQLVALLTQHKFQTGFFRGISNDDQ